MYFRLKSLIMQGVIPPGARINIEDVARQLEVSPTPVRESLARLESDGLVNKQPLKGYRTTDLPGRDTMGELYEFRLLLEPHAAHRAALAMDPDRIARLRAEIDSGAVSAAAAGEEQLLEMSNHDTRLHDLVLEFAGNETIRQAFARTHWHLHTFRLAHAGAVSSRAIVEHTAIVEAIVSGDPDQAESAMRQHITSSRDRVLG